MYWPGAYRCGNDQSHSYNAGHNACNFAIHSICSYVLLGEVVSKDVKIMKSQAELGNWNIIRRRGTTAHEALAAGAGGRPCGGCCSQ